MLQPKSKGDAIDFNKDRDKGIKEPAQEDQMRLCHIISYGLLIFFLQCCSNNQKADILDRYWNEIDSTKPSVPIDVFEEVWQFKEGEIRDTLTSDDFIRAIAWELNHQNTDYRWFERALENDSRHEDVIITLCAVTSKCNPEDPALLHQDLCYFSIAASAKLVIDDSFDLGTDEDCPKLLLKLAGFQKAKRVLLEQILFQLREGVGVCNLTLDLSEK